MPTRSEGADDSNMRAAAARTDTTSSINRSVSSNTIATKRCGIAGATGADARIAGDFSASGVAGTAGMTAWDSGVSTLNVEIVCGLRLSWSWKSSFFKLVMTLPWESRTTTRTCTRFTRTLKVGAVSRLETSAPLESEDEGGGDCGGGGGVAESVFGVVPESGGP